MKNLKRITAILLAALMLTACMPAAVAGETTEIAVDAEHTANLELLAALGLITDTEVFADPAAQLTRINLVKAMISYMNYDGLVYPTTEQIFADVDPDSAYNPYVSAGAKLGILTGFSDGNFYPDAAANMHQTVKIVTSLFGYNDIALLRGGYPEGYLVIANETGLLKGIDDFENLTNKQLLRILKNGLMAEIMISGGVDKNDISITKGGKFLEERYETYMGKGVLNVTNENAVIGKAETEKNRVIIGETEFYTQDSDITKYFGYTLEFYYKNEEGRNNIIYYVPSKDNATITVYGEDISGTHPDFNEYNFVYTVDEREEQIEVNSKGVVYNGKTNPYYTRANLFAEDGEVTFLDNNGDGSYDFVFVFDPQYTMLVRSVTNEAGVIAIYDNINSTAYVEFPNKTSTRSYSVEKDGEKVDISSVMQGDVVLVGISKDNDFAVIKAATGSVSGTVTSVDTSGNSVVVDGVTYEFTEEYKNLYTAGETTYVNELKAGFTGTYYRNAYGKIVAAKKDPSKELLYGFVFAAGEERPGMLNPTVMVKMLTENNENGMFRLDEKVLLNGTKTDAIKVAEALNANNSIEDLGKGAGAYQIVKYKKNENGVITTIYTTASEEIEYAGSFDQTREYSHYLGSWGRTTYHDATSTIFRIYPDEEKSTASSTYDSRDKSNNLMHFYDKDEMLVVGAAVRYYTATAADQNAGFDETDNFVIIKQRVSIYDEAEGTPAEALKGVSTTGSEVVIKISESTNDYVKSVFNKVVPGDVVFYSMDNMGELDSLWRVFDKSKPDTFGATYTERNTAGQHKGPQENEEVGTVLSWLDKTRWVNYGKIDKIIDGYTFYYVEKDANGDPVNTRDNITSISKALLDLSGGDVSVTPNYPMEKVKPGDRILIWGQWQNVKDVVIIRTE